MPRLDDLADDLRYRLRALLRRDRVESELRDEIAAHVAHRAREYTAAGMSPIDAERRARLELGGIETVKEQCRDQRGVSLVETAIQDVRYACRALIARPGFTLAALITLALGLGVNAAVFTVVRSVLLRPLPYTDPDRLVALWPGRTISNAEFVTLQARVRSVSQLAAISPGWGVYSSGPGEPAHLDAGRISTNFFATLGVSPALGRGFVEGESRPGAWNVAILGHELWAQRYAGDSGIVGKTIMIDGTAHAIVGVMPAGFEAYNRRIEIWLPLMIDPASPFHTGQTALALGRLAPRATADQTQKELAALVPEMRAMFNYPADYGTGPLRVEDLRTSLIGSARRPLAALFGAAVFIVLIAGANVGSLMLTRGTARAREIVVRAALGASRGRILRLFMAESLCLAIAGGALGLVAGTVGARVLRQLLPADFPRRTEIAIDANVALVCMAIAIVVGLAFGFAPALLAARADPQEALRGARGVGDRGGGRGGSRVRSGLIVAEVALALVLSVGAGLMLRTVWQLYAVDLGFRPDHLLTLRLEPSRARVDDPRQRPAYYGEMLPRIAAIPGVEVVGGSHHLPLSGFNWNGRVEIERKPQPAGSNLPRVVWRVVAGDYFEAMEIPLVRGRRFTPADTRDAPAVVMINATMARHLWPGRDPLGERIRVGNATRNEWATIVGIVGDVRWGALDTPPGDEMYRPILQQNQVFTHLAIRTRGDPLAALPAVRAAIRSVDGAAAISGVAPFESLISQSIAARRAVMHLLIAFAIAGVALGMVGVHGVVAFAVSQRTREMGIRSALGASGDVLVRGLVAEGARLAVIGVALGAVGSFVASQTLAELLFGVTPADPLTYAGLSAGMITVALLASYVPARQALKIDPVTALRAE